MRDVICADEITHSYKDGPNKKYILKNSSFRIKEGCTYAIIGKSGLGKTTILKILYGIEKIDKGSIKINDIILTEYKVEDMLEIRKNRIGFIFQDFHLLDFLNVRENILLSYNFSNKQVKEEDLYEIMDCLDLSRNLLHKKINELSGGEQQRVAMARALVSKPKILFADEPTGNLDLETENRTLELLDNINKRLKTTIIIVTHSSNVANNMDYKLTIKDGKLKQCE